MPVLRAGHLDGSWGADGPLRLFASSGEERYAALAAGLFRDGISISGRLRLGGSGEPRILIFADAERSRGVRIELGSFDGDPLRIFRGRRGVWRTLSERAYGKIPSSGVLDIDIDVRGGRLRLRRSGIDLLGARGVSLGSGLRPGRILIGVADGSLSSSDLRVRGRLSSASIKRLRRRGERVPFPELHLHRTSLRRALAPEPPSGFEAEFDAPGAKRLARLWEQASAGAWGRCLPELRAFSKSVPKSPTLALLRGAGELLYAGDAQLALESLSGATAGADRDSLMIDAYAMLGDLEAWEKKLPALVPPHDSGGARELLKWCRGQRKLELQALARGMEGPCHHCAQRASSAWLLHQMNRWPRLRAVRKEGLCVLSDVGSSQARYLATAALRWRKALDAFLPGPVRPSSLLILALDDPRQYEAWNERLGGAGHFETDGIYRPGLNLIVIRDDEDRRSVEARLAHELVHHAVFERRWDLPPLFEEGLATAIAYASPTRSGLRKLDEKDLPRWRLARSLAGRSQFIEPARLFLLSPGEGRVGRSRYAQAWAAVSWALQDDADAFKDLLLSLQGQNVGCESRRSSWPAILGEAFSREAVVESLIDSADGLGR